jgi:predicted acetyltransferase
VKRAHADAIRPLREAELEQLMAVRQIAFLDRSDPHDPETRARHRARLPYTWGHFVGEALASAAVMYPFGMFLAGSRVPVGGLAAVLSAPEHRRRGGVRELLARLLAELQRAGVGWCLEYPFDSRFYARYGFANVPNGAEFTIPSERLYRGAAPEGARRVGTEAAPQMAEIYAAWAAQHTFTLVRGGEAEAAHPSWPRILGAPRFSYLLEDAYCVLELSEEEGDQTLTVRDYAYRSPAGYEALWRFIGSFYGQVRWVRVQLADDDPLWLELKPYSTGALPPLQARIVDVPRALAAFSSPHARRFTLRVEDAFCPWNARTFGVELGPEVTLTPTAEAPELTLDVATLTQLVSGALSASAAARTGAVRGDLGAARALAALALEHRPFMPAADFF